MNPTEKPQVLPTGGMPYTEMKESEAASGRKIGIDYGIPAYDMPELEDQSQSTLGHAYRIKLNFIMPKGWKDVAWITNDVFCGRTELSIQKV